jgi:hypothetical protein
MIRYPFDDAQVAQDISAIDPRWASKAAKRAVKIRRDGAYLEKSSIWSTVKPVFMLLQHNKCAYCERQFENPDYGTIEFDVEHFRPKSAVPAWPDPVRHAGQHYSYETGSVGAGYHWLAYDLSNYAASCKICNSICKLNFFPVAGARAAQPAMDIGEADARQALADEQPFLCYPIGGADEDPQDLITFRATTAVPVGATEPQRRRGEIIINFFALNEREQLHRERARMISLIGNAVGNVGQPLPPSAIARYSLASYPHAGCIRAFLSLWATNPATAQRIHQACSAYALTGDSVVPTAA